MAKTTEMVEVTVSSLRPYERNAKKHPAEQIEKIKESIKEFGFLSPCLIDRENRIIAGHGRVQAAQALGFETVPCVYIEGLTEDQRRAYIIADNRLTELGGWDMGIVSEELESLMDQGFDISLTGFNIDDITIDEIEDIDIPTEEEELEEIEPKTKPGEIWILGNHRLMCGDSTKPEDVQKLMNGEKADLLETDPPYNVDVEYSAGKIKNDNMERNEFLNFLVGAFTNAYEALKEGAAFYIWHPDSNGLDFRLATEKAGLTIKQNLVWVKNTFTIGRQDYQWQHEPCLYGWKEGAAHYFIDMRSLATVQEYDSLEKMDRDQLLRMLKEIIEEAGTVSHEMKPQVSELHPTMKPMSLIKKHVRNSTKEGALVLDLFGGSGTTLMACEEMNRRCNTMEYDPKFADIIIHRWEEKTGEKAVRE